MNRRDFLKFLGAGTVLAGSLYVPKKKYFFFWNNPLADSEPFEFNFFEFNSFGIDSLTVSAKSRGLKATYTLESQEYLHVIPNSDAQAELSRLLINEMNREFVNVIRGTAVKGSKSYDFDTDSDGRWVV